MFSASMNWNYNFDSIIWGRGKAPVCTSPWYPPAPAFHKTRFCLCARCKGRPEHWLLRLTSLIWRGFLSPGNTDWHVVSIYFVKRTLVENFLQNVDLYLVLYSDVRILPLCAWHGKAPADVSQMREVKTLQLVLECLSLYIHYIYVYILIRRVTYWY